MQPLMPDIFDRPLDSNGELLDLVKAEAAGGAATDGSPQTIADEPAPQPKRRGRSKKAVDG